MDERREKLNSIRKTAMQVGNSVDEGTIDFLLSLPIGVQERNIRPWIPELSEIVSHKLGKWQTRDMMYARV